MRERKGNMSIKEHIASYFAGKPNEDFSVALNYAFIDTNPQLFSGEYMSSPAFLTEDNNVVLAQAKELPWDFEGKELSDINIPEDFAHYFEEYLETINTDIDLYVPYVPLLVKQNSAVSLTFHTRFGVREKT